MMHTIPAAVLKTRVRRLTVLCLSLWFAATLVPIWAARRHDLRIWGWPLDFWMAAQGCVLVYLLIVTVYAGLVNRWERQAEALSFELPATQEV